MIKKLAGILLIIVIFITSFGTQPLKEEVKAQPEILSCAPVPDGLVYWLRGESNAEDETGNHDGTLEGGTTFTTGMVGQAFSFDGIDDNVEILQHEDLPNGADPRTIEMWIYSQEDTWDGDYDTPFHSGFAGIQQAFGIVFYSHPRIDFYTWGNDLPIITTLPETGWFHVAMTYGTDNSIKAYINGELKGSLTLTGLLNTLNTPTSIGGGHISEGFDRPFLGNLDEVSMYNRELTADEIQSIYIAGPAGKCMNQAPVANAGNDQNVKTLSAVQLDGTQSYDPNDDLPLSYLWTQTSGTEVEILFPTSPMPIFTAPSDADTLIFSLVVTDASGLPSEPDTVVVNVSMYQYFLPLVKK